MDLQGESRNSLIQLLRRRQLVATQSPCEATKRDIKQEDGSDLSINYKYLATRRFSACQMLVIAEKSSALDLESRR